MRNSRLTSVVYAAVLILALYSSMIAPSFLCTANEHAHELTDLRANMNSPRFAQPVIHHPDRIDEDSDGIQDSLETAISQAIENRSSVLPVVVTLYNPVSSQDLNWFTILGGEVTYVYNFVTYGFAGNYRKTC